VLRRLAVIAIFVTVLATTTVVAFAAGDRRNGSHYTLRVGDTAWADPAAVRCYVMKPSPPAPEGRARPSQADLAVLQRSTPLLCDQMGRGLYSSYSVYMTDRGVVVKQGGKVLFSRAN